MSLNTQPFSQVAFGVFAPPAWIRRFGARTIRATFSLWHVRRRTRQHLSTLDDRALADVGLTRAQQSGECAKSFWQL